MSYNQQIKSFRYEIRTAICNKLVSLEKHNLLSGSSLCSLSNTKKREGEKGLFYGLKVMLSF